MMKCVDDIRKRSLSEKAPIASGRCDKKEKFCFDDLVFVPAQLDKTPVDYCREKINSETVIGKLSKSPLKLNMPILNAGMSFGALSKEAKIVLAKASAEAGTAANTGEGGMLAEERQYAKLLIAQYSTARFGVDEDYLKKADAIEVKIGQGAKPGQGGLLPKEKVTEEIAKIRKVKANEDIHSPASHHDINNIDELNEKIKLLKEITDNKPIVLKIAAGDIEKDMEIAVKSGADVIAIDGMYGGTGAAPEVMLNDVGTPILPAISKAREILDKTNSKQELIVGGGLNKGADFAKAIALGADAVFLGFPLLVAMGCIYCKLCYKGKCPIGVTTQDETLRKKLNIEKAVKKVVNYLKSCNEEIKMIAGAVGKDDVSNLDKDDLRSLDYNLTKIIDVKGV